jgi:hypothetical protein
MAGIPAGRTSSVETLEKTFILQTEFRPAPRPVIVTSVSLDGRTVHKVERSYSEPYDTEEGLSAAEATIIAQHEGLAKKIMANGADFIRQTGSIKISKADWLGVIPGVSYVANIDEKLATENPPAIYIQSMLILAIADAISQSSRSGAFKAGAIISDHGKYIVDREENTGFLISLKADADIGRVLNEVQGK